MGDNQVFDGNTLVFAFGSAFQLVDHDGGVQSEHRGGVFFDAAGLGHVCVDEGELDVHPMVDADSVGDRVVLHRREMDVRQGEIASDTGLFHTH